MIKNNGPRKKILVFVLMLTAAIIIIPAAASASGGEGGEHAEPKGWVATDTYRVMNFSVLFIALFFLLKKPVSDALAKRISDIKDQINSLEGEKNQVEKQMVEYTQKISLLDQETKKIMEEYARQGNDAKERILSEAKNAAEKLEEQAKKNIANEFQRTKDMIHAEIIEKALVKAEAVIKEKVTDEDQVRLVDEYLEKVVA